MDESELLARHPWLPYAGVEPGWFQILDELCVQIEQRLADLGLTTACLHVRQIKEKFGGLRFYYSRDSSVNFDLLDLVEAAKERSTRTCSTCGKPGELRLTPRGWVIAACPDHDRPGSRRYQDVLDEVEANPDLSMLTVLQRMQDALRNASG